MSDKHRELYDKLMEGINNGDFSTAEGIKRLTDEMLDIVDGDTNDLDLFLRDMLITSLLDDGFISNLNFQQL